MGLYLSVVRSLYRLHLGFLPGLYKPNKMYRAVVGYIGYVWRLFWNSFENINWKPGMHWLRWETWYAIRGLQGTMCPKQISRHMLSWIKQLILFWRIFVKTVVGIINDYSILLAKANSSEETNIAQEPKHTSQMNSNDGGPQPGGSKKGNNKHKDKGIGDVTAESRKEMRTRSDRSSVNQNTKGHSSTPSGKHKEILRQHKVLAGLLIKYLDPDSGLYNGIIRIMDAEFLKYCYSLIKSKPGNMTMGATTETLDGIRESWFDETADKLLKGTFKFSPSRAVLIPKTGKKGEYRTLQVGNPRDKIVQKGMQLILNEIWDPTFSEHGPGKSLMHALDHIHMRGGSMSWVINGDISKCFDQIPHKVIMKELGTRVSCARFISLMNIMLTAGYIDDNKQLHYNRIGTPQGNIVSPLLANMVLNSLDQFVEVELKDDLNYGEKRSANPEYTRLENQRKYYKLRDPVKAKQALLDMRKIPKLNMSDPDFARALYVRYADDFIILIAGTKAQALKVRVKIAEFLLKETGLSLNMNKTTITNTREGTIFLGALIKRRTNIGIFNSFKSKNGNNITRRSTLRMAVDAPVKQILQWLIDNGFARRNHLNKLLAKGKTSIIHLSHFDILRFYNAKITGILNAYSFAGNFSSMASVVWILRQSCALTLARKFKLKTMRKTFSAFGFNLTDGGTGLELKVPDTFAAKQDFGTYKDGPANQSKKASAVVSTNTVEFTLPEEIEKDILDKVNKSV